MRSWAPRIGRSLFSALLAPYHRLASVVETIATWWRLRRQPGRPVVVFQMGKVGSRSVYFALRPALAPRPVFHVHNLRPRTPHLAHELVRRAVVDQGRPADFVVLVRDPIARSISAFFELSPPREAEPYDLVSETRRFIDAAPHDAVLWFERHVQSVLGLDVYAHPFAGGSACLDVPNSGHRVLLLRSESGDAHKAQALSAFLGVGDVRLSRFNETSRKRQGSLYERFVTQARIPEPYVYLMLATRYAHHFYDEAERERLRLYWTTCPRPARGPLRPLEP